MWGANWLKIHIFKNSNRSQVEVMDNKCGGKKTKWLFPDLMIQVKPQWTGCWHGYNIGPKLCEIAYVFKIWKHKTFFKRRRRIPPPNTCTFKADKSEHSNLCKWPTPFCTGVSVLLMMVSRLQAVFSPLKTHRQLWLTAVSLALVEWTSRALMTSYAGFTRPFAHPARPVSLALKF